MKILFVIDTLRGGGKERQLTELLKGLAGEKGFSLTVAVVIEEIHYEELFELDIDLHFLSESSTGNGNTSVFSALYKLCKTVKPDIIHTWNLKTSLMAIIPAKRFGIKFLNGSVRNAIPNTRGFNKFRLLSRLSFWFADAIAANSLTGLHNQGYTRPKGVCIHNGFDLSRISALEDAGIVRERFGITTGKVVGMVGSFVDAKDYKTFIAAAGRIAAKRDDVTFAAVGDGPELAGFREGMDAAIKDRFKFLGEQTDVESIVNIFDVGVLACNTKGHAEGLSNSIMEYMALGKPVVATHSGGNSELVRDNETGFMVGAFDVDELTARLEFLLENEDKALEMGRAGHRRIEEFFSLDLMVREYIRLYNHMVNVK